MGKEKAFDGTWSGRVKKKLKLVSKQKTVRDYSGLLVEFHFLFKNMPLNLMSFKLRARLRGGCQRQIIEVGNWTMDEYYDNDEWYPFGYFPTNGCQKVQLFF